MSALSITLGFLQAASLLVIALSNLVTAKALRTLTARLSACNSGGAA